jgi:hypothetical protein
LPCMWIRFLQQLIYMQPKWWIGHTVNKAQGKSVRLHNHNDGSCPLTGAGPTGSSSPQKDCWTWITFKYSVHTAQ